MKKNDEFQTSSKEIFKIEVYLVVLDQISVTITSRFEGARKILSDLSLFSVDRLLTASKEDPIPKDAFLYLDKWIPNLQMEYFTFLLAL